MAATTTRVSRRPRTTTLGGGSGFQEGVDEVVKLAVQDPVHVRGLLVRAVVLGQLVGVEDVGADLAPPLVVGLLPALGGDLPLALLPLELEEPRLEDAHSDLPVLVLAALVLALGHDAGRQVRDPHGRVGLVYVLPAGAGSPVGVHLEVFLVHLDLDGLPHHGGHRDGGEARVPPAARVERADPDEPVHAPLRREQPEGVLALYGEGGALDAGLLPLGVLDDLQPEPPPLGPPPVHPREHLGPVLRIDPAGPRVYGEDRVALVVVPREEPGHLLLLQNLLDPPELLPHLGEKRPETSLAVSGSSQKPGRLISSPSSSTSAPRRPTSKNVSSSARRPSSSAVFSLSSANYPVRTSGASVELIGTLSGGAPGCPWHFLNFLPLPHGHGSFRPTLLASALRGLFGRSLGSSVPPL